jgi:hypothetical protein
VFAAVFSAAVAWAWWRYREAAIRTDERGIIQNTFFGPRQIAWGEIERCTVRGSDLLKFGIVIGGGCRIRFWLGIGDAEELKAEIARRAYRARGWESYRH